MKRVKKRDACDGKSRHEYEAQAKGHRATLVAGGAPEWRHR